MLRCAALRCGIAGWGGKGQHRSTPSAAAKPPQPLPVGRRQSPQVPTAAKPPQPPPTPSAAHRAQVLPAANSNHARRLVACSVKRPERERLTGEGARGVLGRTCCCRDSGKAGARCAGATMRGCTATEARPNGRCRPFQRPQAQANTPQARVATKATQWAVGKKRFRARGGVWRARTRLLPQLPQRRRLGGLPAVHQPRRKLDGHGIQRRPELGWNGLVWFGLVLIRFVWFVFLCFGFVWFGEWGCVSWSAGLRPPQRCSADGGGAQERGAATKSDGQRCSRPRAHPGARVPTCLTTTSRGGRAADFTTANTATASTPCVPSRAAAVVHRSTACQRRGTSDRGGRVYSRSTRRRNRPSATVRRPVTAAARCCCCCCWRGAAAAPPSSAAAGASPPRRHRGPGLAPLPEIALRSQECAMAPAGGARRAIPEFERVKHRRTSPWSRARLTAVFSFNKTPNEPSLSCGQALRAPLAAVQIRLPRARVAITRFFPCPHTRGMASLQCGRDGRPHALGALWLAR